jgi:tetratricopeptide (TPR) repeat protein
VALSALKRPDEAAREYEVFERASAAVPDTRLVHMNKAKTVLEIGLNMARGEMEYRRGNVDKAFELLRTAVRQDDALRYDEPWGWMQPVRHALGALLLEQGRIAEAEAVYRQDLRLHPDNGWALHGLVECLHRQGRTDEMAEVSTRLQKSWARSDITLRASCFCRRDSRTEAD